MPSCEDLRRPENIQHGTVSHTWGDPLSYSFFTRYLKKSFLCDYGLPPLELVHWRYGWLVYEHTLAHDEIPEVSLNPYSEQESIMHYDLLHVVMTV